MDDNDRLIREYPLFLDRLSMLAVGGVVLEVLFVAGGVVAVILEHDGLRGGPIFWVLALVSASAAIAGLVSLLIRLGRAIRALTG